MFNTKKRILSMTLIAVILFGMLINVYATPSSWAEPFVKAMLLEGLVSEELLDSNKMQQPITREEFAELTVRLYAKSKGQTVQELVQWNPFADTDNEMVAKAYNIGIVSGTGTDSLDRKLFSPDNQVTRQEIAVMLVKELKILDIDTSDSNNLSYSDEDAIATWAYDAVAFASSNGILSGVGDNKVAPTSNATREQALVLIHKIATKYGWVDSQYTTTRFNSMNSTESLGFKIPNNNASELVVIKTSSGIKYTISNMVSGYVPNIKQQQEDMINILYQSDNVKYDSLLVLYDLIYDSYDPISKKFYSSDSVYINLNTGVQTNTKQNGPCIKLTVDGQITLEYFN